MSCHVNHPHFFYTCPGRSWHRCQISPWIPTTEDVQPPEKPVELWAYKYAEKNILQPHPTNFNSIITSVSWESSINLALHPYSIHFLTRFISLQNARIKPAEESRVSEAYNDLSFFSLGTPYVSTAKIAWL